MSTPSQWWGSANYCRDWISGPAAILRPVATKCLRGWRPSSVDFLPWMKSSAAKDSPKSAWQPFCIAVLEESWRFQNFICHITSTFRTTSDLLACLSPNPSARLKPLCLQFSKNQTGWKSLLGQHNWYWKFRPHTTAPTQWCSPQSGCWRVLLSSSLARTHCQRPGR